MVCIYAFKIYTFNIYKYGMYNYIIYINIILYIIHKYNIVYTRTHLHISGSRNLT